MANSKCVEDFENACNLAMDLLKVTHPQDGRVQVELEKFASERATYALYLINQIRGTRHRRGSVAAEQNHSSVLSFLNGGKKGINHYCEVPMTLIKELFARQKTHINKWNQLLYARNQKMNIKVHCLKQKPPTQTNINLINAAQVLDLNAYERFENNQKTADECLVLTWTGDEFHIKDKFNPEKIQNFKTKKQRCICVFSVAMDEQCPHEIRLNNAFVIENFTEHSLRRSKVEGSLNGWERKASNLDVGAHYACLLHASSCYLHMIEQHIASLLTLLGNI